MAPVGTQRVKAHVLNLLANDIIAAQRDGLGPDIPSARDLARTTTTETQNLSGLNQAALQGLAQNVSSDDLLAASSAPILDAIDSVAGKTGSVDARFLSLAEIQDIKDPNIRLLISRAYSYAQWRDPEPVTVSALAESRRAQGGFTICGVDDRRPSSDPKIGRISKSAGNPGCSMTMISDTVAISAGHCSSYLQVAEFNVPSSVGGNTRAAKREDQYRVVPGSMQFIDGGIGNDWAVFRLEPNRVTGRNPGEVQGRYPVSYERPSVGTIVRITGYGRDSEPDRNFAQQTHHGPVSSLNRSAMYHKADTQGGNSGSTVRRNNDGAILGIHTHGGCDSQGNGSTLIATHPQLRRAIERALREERIERKVN